ncbi:hypothetical protein ACMAZE_12670 [Pseudopelagicola sp. nBUS_20]|uniref:hypothetical protein n=1 Tax=Pseudopelagicola sp. nBUS_20 TaxID=3395317 RepID=UPI003EBD8572
MSMKKTSAKYQALMLSKSYAELEPENFDVLPEAAHPYYEAIIKSRPAHLWTRIDLLAAVNLAFIT